MTSPKPRSNNVTALGKLLRTTAFKLTLVYLGIFVLFAASLLAYFALNTRRIITEQITATVNGEVSGLSEQYGKGGLRRLSSWSMCVRAVQAPAYIWSQRRAAKVLPAMSVRWNP